MEIYFYDFLGTGRAPTLAHPIVGVHSMLPPQKNQKKTNYGGVIWCVLVYILIRFFLKKKKNILCKSSDI